MDKEEEEVENYQSLPDEIIFLIFSKVPAKSICRFRCISHQWNSTFSDSQFIKSHHHHHQSTGWNILITFPNETNEAKLIYSAAAASTSTSIAAADLHLSIPGWVHSQVTESVNGLICFDVEKKYRICNPTTRQCITLPSSSPSPNHKSMHHYDITTFGYDRVEDTFKVLNSWVVSSGGAMTMEHYVFVLGARSWRRINDCVLHFSRREGVCLNSAVYYRASCARLNHPDDSAAAAEILVEFDVRLEVFRFHKLTTAASHLDHDYTSLIPLDGKLTIVDYEHVLSKSKVDFWVCEDLENRRWVHKRIRFSSAWKGDAFASHLVLNFAGTSRAGEIIMAPSSLSDPFYLIYFSLKSGKARRVEIRGLPEKGLRFGITSNRFTATDHVENLVSLKTSVCL